MSLSFCMNAYEVKIISRVRCSCICRRRRKCARPGVASGRVRSYALVERAPSKMAPSRETCAVRCVRRLCKVKSCGAWSLDQCDAQWGISSSGPNGMCACLPQDRLSLSAGRSNGYERSGSVQLCRTTCCSSVQQAQSWTLTPEVLDVALNVTAPIPVAGKDGALTIRRRTCLWLRIV